MEKVLEKIEEIAKKLDNVQQNCNDIDYSKNSELVYNLRCDLECLREDIEDLTWDGVKLYFMAKATDCLTDVFKKPITYNILSPDGFKLRHEDFKTKLHAMLYFDEWKKGFMKQGYYSANGRKIDLDDLEDECEIIKIEP